MVLVSPVVLDDLSSVPCKVRLAVGIVADVYERELKLSNVAAGRLDALVQVLRQLTEVVVGVLGRLKIGPEL